MIVSGYRNRKQIHIGVGLNRRNRQLPIETSAINDRLHFLSYVLEPVFCIGILAADCLRNRELVDPVCLGRIQLGMSDRWPHECDCE